MEEKHQEVAKCKDQQDEYPVPDGSRKRMLEDKAVVDATRDAKEPRLQEQCVASGGSSAAKPQGDNSTPATDPPSPAERAGSVPHATGTYLTAAYSEDKGCRNTMEDVCVLQLDARPEEHQPNCSLAYFGIFDGHGGVSCASFAAQHLHSRVLDSGLIRKGLPSPNGKPDAKACKAAIVEGYKKTDEALLKECTAMNWQDGACAVTVWVLQGLVLVANVGDAKCVLGRLPEKVAGSSSNNRNNNINIKSSSTNTSTTAGTGTAVDPKPRAILLTKEHTALLERQRIEKAGGSVVNGRLAGRIQVARSFGDAAFKKMGCSGTPDVTAFQLTSRDLFLLLGCDGFWGVFGAQEAVDVVHSLLNEGLGAKAVTNRLINIAVREKRCKDNCSVMLVWFGTVGGSAGPGTDTV